MNPWSKLLFSFLVLLASLSCQKEKNEWPGKSRVDQFVLFDNEFSSFDLERNADAKAIVFIAHTSGCPIGKRMYSTVENLKEKFQKQGVLFRYINSSLVDTLETHIAEKEKYKLTVPILRDPTQQVTKRLGLDTSTQVVVLDGRTRAKLYKGPIDDSQDFNGEKISGINHYLEKALTDILDGKVPQVEESLITKGCVISFDKDVPVYYGEVDKILYNKCIVCHSGALSNVRLDSYEAAKEWSAMIAKTILIKQMPPWDFEFDKIVDVKKDVVFKGLSDSEARTLVNWTRGALKGNIKEASKLSPEEESLGKVISFKTPVTEVPASGVPKFKDYQVAGPLEKDIVFDAFEIKTAFENVHHIMIYNHKEPIPANLATLDYVKLTNFLESVQSIPWTSKNIIRKYKFRKGYAYRFAKGSYIALQLHPKVNGRPTSFATELLLSEVDKKQKVKIMTTGAKWHEKMKIVPEKRNQTFRVEKVLEKDMSFLRFGAHMHLRGAEFKLFLKRNQKTEEELIFSIPYFNIKRSEGFDLAKPLHLKKGDSLVFYGTYDNSELMHGNPDPKATVLSGHQVETNEMLVLRYSYF